MNVMLEGARTIHLRRPFLPRRASDGSVTVGVSPCREQIDVIESTAGTREIVRYLILAAVPRSQHNTAGLQGEADRFCIALVGAGKSGE